MSLPPQTIRIKRPRDEAPVQALYIDGNARTPQKRQRTGHSPDYVFRLAHTVTSPTDPTPRPFQPKTSSPPRRYGVPQVRSTLLSSSEPGSLPSPGSPSTVLPLTPLKPRSTSTATTPQSGEKLVLDTATVTASPSTLLKAPVPLSAISSNGGSALESQNVVPPNSPPASSPVQAPERHEALRHDTFGNESPRAGGLTPAVKRKNGEMERELGDEDEKRSGTKRKITPVRRYQLAKRLRVKHSHHPYSSATRRSAIFTRVAETNDTGTGRAGETAVVEITPGPVVERKRPRTHPEEKKRLEEQRKAEEKKIAKGKEVKFQEQEDDNDPLIAPFHAMVLEHLNSPSNDGIRNLPSLSSLAKLKTATSKIGGGVGGGTWGGSEEEDGFVYDVYIREELPASIDKKEGDYGVLVIEGSDDEEWWYEGDPDEGSEDDVWASDDEDSNAEDFHTNDYPEEPVYDSEDDLPRRFDPSDDDTDDDPNVFKPWIRGGQRFGDEEFDLDDDDDDEDGEGRFKVKRGIWDMIGGDEADDEEE